MAGCADYETAPAWLWMLDDSSDGSYPHLGLQPSNFQGAWHGSTLVLDVLSEWYNGHTYVSSSSIPDEVNAVPVTLHKGGYSAYQAACACI